jgi:hypothetical protein
MGRASRFRRVQSCHKRDLGLTDAQLYCGLARALVAIVTGFRRREGTVRIFHIIALAALSGCAPSAIPALDRNPPRMAEQAVCHDLAQLRIPAHPSKVEWGQNVRRRYSEKQYTALGRPVVANFLPGEGVDGICWITIPKQYATCGIDRISDSIRINMADSRYYQDNRIDLDCVHEEFDAVNRRNFDLRIRSNLYAISMFKVLDSKDICSSYENGSYADIVSAASEESSATGAAVPEAFFVAAGIDKACGRLDSYRKNLELAGRSGYSPAEMEVNKGENP